MDMNIALVIQAIVLAAVIGILLSIGEEYRTERKGRR